MKISSQNPLGGIFPPVTAPTVPVASGRAGVSSTDQGAVTQNLKYSNETFETEENRRAYAGVLGSLASGQESFVQAHSGLDPERVRRLLEL